jgi:hypothetical protein
MTYEDRVEQAIAAKDIETLVKFAYGYPCKCTKLAGEPLCICKMQAKALREKISPLGLFSGNIERIEQAAPEPAPAAGSMFAFWRR